MRRFSVKLDDQGRVVGFGPGPARDGWTDVTDELAVRSDPLRWCLDAGEWREMTDAECQQRDIDHEPPPPDTSALDRLRALKGKQLTAAQLQQAVADIINTVA